MREFVEICGIDFKLKFDIECKAFKKNTLPSHAKHDLTRISKTTNPTKATTKTSITQSLKAHPYTTMDLYL